MQHRCTAITLFGFRRWIATVTARMCDDVHTGTLLQIASHSGLVRLMVIREH